MDIDEPLAGSPEPGFSLIFPLPYRCLFLVGIGILGWATNLHFLYFLGIDTGQALAIPRGSSHHSHLTSPGIPISLPLTPSPGGNGIGVHGGVTFAHPSTLYRGVYRLFLWYGAAVGGSWVFFRLTTSGLAKATDTAKWIPSITIIVLLIALLAPWSPQRLERMIFLRATIRTLVPSLKQTIHFSDVLLADIFTSFAKVFGDFWLAALMLMGSDHLWLLPVEKGTSQWVTPILMSLPYAIRLRQCLSEYFTTGSRRSLFNAAKYFTAFPVIFLSAAQRLIPDSNATHPTIKYQETSGHPLFQLWAFSVFVNSVYSFWWDITNDWGLSLLSFRFSSRRHHPATPANTYPPSPLPWHNPSPTASDDGYWGLRSQLVFTDPLIYYIAIFVNFVLRFTWSLKLSSHLHHVADLEAGVFLVELLEVVRRWIWVFLRVEWEVLKLSQLGNSGRGGGEMEMGETRREIGRGRSLEREGEEYQFLMRDRSRETASEISDI